MARSGIRPLSMGPQPFVNRMRKSSALSARTAGNRLWKQGVALRSDFGPCQRSHAHPLDASAARKVGHAADAGPSHPRGIFVDTCGRTPAAARTACHRKRLTDGSAAAFPLCHSGSALRPARDEVHHGQSTWLWNKDGRLALSFGELAITLCRGHTRAPCGDMLGRVPDGRAACSRACAHTAAASHMCHLQRQPWRSCPFASRMGPYCCSLYLMDFGACF